MNSNSAIQVEPRRPEELNLRACQRGDLDFLLQVYASTRREEIALLDWDQQQKEAFLHSQAEAQHKHYQKFYGDAQYLVIEWAGKPAGRLYVARWEEEIRIVDIALLPEYRTRGIGKLLIEELLQEAGGLGKAVRIHVEKMNRAMSLYERLGFKSVEDKGVYWLLEWRKP